MTLEAHGTTIRKPRTSTRSPTYTEPAQLFALAVNTEPTQMLARSCSDGSEGKDYKFCWFISHEEGHGYIVPESEREVDDSNR